MVTLQQIKLGRAMVYTDSTAGSTGSSILSGAGSTGSSILSGVLALTPVFKTRVIVSNNKNDLIIGNNVS